MELVNNFLDIWPYIVFSIPVFVIILLVVEHFNTKCEMKEYEEEKKRKIRETYKDGKIVKYNKHQQEMLEFWEHKYGDVEKLYMSCFSYNALSKVIEIDFYDDAGIFFFDFNENSGIRYDRIVDCYSSKDGSYICVKVVDRLNNMPLQYDFVLENEAKAFEKKMLQCCMKQK